MTAALWAGAFCGLITGVNLLSLAVGAFRIRRPRAPLPVPLGPPPVSIVRPVCGIETFSEETLRAGFELDYPDYEVVVCVQRASDPIIPLVQRMLAEYSAIPSRLLIGDDRVSSNPKLNNCVKGWNAARHDWIVLADSNVLMPPDYVQRLMASWRPDTGLVCSTPAGSRPDGFWAEVECAFLNTLQARWQYVGEAFGLGFAQGKSMLWRRELLEPHGGLSALAAEIAEDAAATKLVRQAGLHVHLVDTPFEQPLGRRTASEIWSRQLRWARLRRVTFPLFFAPEIGIGVALPLAAGIASAWGSAGAVAAISVGLLLAWYGGEALLARRTGWYFSWRMPLAFLVRDVLLVPMWISAWFADKIVWRGNAMTIGTRESDLVPGDTPA